MSGDGGRARGPPPATSGHGRGAGSPVDGGNKKQEQPMINILNDVLNNVLVFVNVL